MVVVVGRGGRSRSWVRFVLVGVVFGIFVLLVPVRINEAAPAAHFLVVGVGGGGREVGVTGSLVGAGGEFR